MLWAGRNTENHGGGSTHVFHDVPLPTNMAPIAEVSAGHDHVLILTGNLFDTANIYTQALTYLVNGEVYSFGTAQALIGHSAQPFDLPRRVPELVGKKIVQIAAGLYANAFLTGLVCCLIISCLNSKSFPRYGRGLGTTLFECRTLKNSIATRQESEISVGGLEPLLCYHRYHSLPFVVKDLLILYTKNVEDNEQYVVPAGTFARKWDVNIVKVYRSSYELGVTGKDIYFKISLCGLCSDSIVYYYRKWGASLFHSLFCLKYTFKYYPNRHERN